MQPVQTVQFAPPAMLALFSPIIPALSAAERDLLTLEVIPTWSASPAQQFCPTAIVALTPMESIPVMTVLWPSIALITSASAVWTLSLAASSAAVPLLAPLVSSPTSLLLMEAALLFLVLWIIVRDVRRVQALLARFALPDSSPRTIRVYLLLAPKALL